MKDLDFSLIIPCFNEERILKKNVAEIIDVFRITNLKFEVIFVDDKSSDNTVNIIKEILKTYPDWHLIAHEKNSGRGSSVRDGIRLSSAEVVGYIDIDLSTTPWYLLRLIDEVKKGADIAAATRVYKLNLRTFFRWVLSKGYNFLVRRMLGCDLQDTEAGCKVFNKMRILPILNRVKEMRWFWDTEIMVRSAREGYKIVEMPTIFIREGLYTTVRVLPDTMDYIFNLFKFRKELSLDKKKMKMGFVYWHPAIYRFVMGLLYGRYFYSRYEAISELLPERSEVLDVCCGDCYLNKLLAKKKIDYLGLDVNPGFVRHALKKGINAKVSDIRNEPVPRAEYVVMQGSLCQFIPRHREILEKLLKSAKRALIISESVRNAASSKNPLISYLSVFSTRVNGESFRKRFTKNELLEIFNEYKASIIKEIRGGRDLVGFFNKA